MEGGVRAVRTGAIVGGGLLALAPGVAAAHDWGWAPAPSGRFPEALAEWSLDPLGFVAAIVLAVAYGWGYRRLRRDAPGFHFSRWHPVAWYGGVAVLLAALISPIDTYASELFWVHMLQHVLLVMGTAPLLLLGAPATLALRSAPARVRRSYFVPVLQSRVLHGLTQPVVAYVLFVLSIWLWHIPAGYDGAVRNEAVHFLEHAAFLSGALLFWWLIIGVDARAGRPGHIGRGALLLLAIFQNIGLALILNSVGDPIYDTYINPLRGWGPDPLTDQRIGAGIMWVPGAMMYGLALIVTVYFWAEHEQFKARQGDLVRALAERSGRAAPGAPGGVQPGGGAPLRKGTA